MRILVVGAGATGGYFGGRLLRVGQDVTFLVRPRRAAELAGNGLVVRSPHGDFTLDNPPTVQAEGVSGAFDLVLLSCKAFDLDGAVAAFARAAGPTTVIIPLLNGMRHLEALDAVFGRERVLGGLCSLAVTLNETREVVHLAPMHSLRFGERDGGASERVWAIAEAFADANCGAQPSETIIQDMWEKWAFLATLAGATCVMRASIGQIVAAAGGRDFILALLDEAAGIAKAAGHAPREEFLSGATAMLTATGSQLTASMFRDIETGARVEADHIMGDLIARAEAAKLPVPKLRTIHTHLKAYENRRG